MISMHCIPYLYNHYFDGTSLSGVALVPSLSAQVAVFVVFTMFRAFLYAVMSTFNAQTFGLNTLGRITGCVFTTSAVVSMLQYVLQRVLQRVLQHLV